MEGDRRGSQTTSEESFDTVYDRHYLECYGRPYGESGNGKEGVERVDDSDRVKIFEYIDAGNVGFEDDSGEVIDVKIDDSTKIHVGPVLNIAKSNIDGDVKATSHYDIHLYLCPKKGTCNFMFYGNCLKSHL